MQFRVFRQHFVVAFSAISCADCLYIVRRQSVTGGRTQSGRFSSVRFGQHNTFDR